MLPHTLNVYRINDSPPREWPPAESLSELSEYSEYVEARETFVDAKSVMAKHGWDEKSEILASVVPNSDGKFTSVFACSVPAKDGDELMSSESVFSPIEAQTGIDVPPQPRTVLVSTRSLTWLERFREE